MKGVGRQARDPVVRFWEKVDKTDRCWIYLGPLNHGGYGRFWDGTGEIRAHRFSYELLIGPIPEGLQIDHLCRTPACVNPDHLEAVTCATNLRRGSRTKLTEAMAKDILASDLGPRELSRRLNVSPSLICQVQGGKLWRGVEAA